jgi:hypothetical protein
MMGSVATELFYIIADAGCAQARATVIEKGLKDKVDFRNLHYEEARRDYEARGGHEVPALWDGVALHQGLEAVLVALGRMT